MHRSWLGLALHRGLVMAVTAMGMVDSSGCGGGPPPDAPDQPGRWAIGHTSMAITDSSRSNRTLQVDAWYPIASQDAHGPQASYGLPPAITMGIGLPGPATVSGSAYEGTAVANGRFPLVVISHGDGGSRLDYYYLTEALASHGFVVVAPDHAGDTVLDSFAQTSVSQAQTLADRPLDISYVITSMLARSDDAKDRFYSRIDGQRIGVGGHSYGGYTTLVVGSGAGSYQPDPRVKALLPIDPFTDTLTPGQLGAEKTPMLYFSGTRSDLHTNVVASFQRTGGQQIYLVDVASAAHQNFSWLCPLAQSLSSAGLPQATLGAVLGPAYAQSCQPPAIASSDAFRLTRLYSVAFFRSALNHESSYDAFLTADYAQKNQPLVSFLARSSSP